MVDVHPGRVFYQEHNGAALPGGLCPQGGLHRLIKDGNLVHISPI